MSKITTTKIERNSAEQGVDRIRERTVQTAAQNQFNENIRFAIDKCARMEIVQYFLENGVSQTPYLQYLET